MTFEEIDQKLELNNKIIDEFVNTFVKFNQKIDGLKANSIMIAVRIHPLKEKSANDINKIPLLLYLDQQLKGFINILSNNIKFPKHKGLNALFKEEAPYVYKKQPHRFEFINGILNYNDITLYKGQKLTYIESKLGKNYIETSKQDDKHYRVIRYKNIPLEIGSLNGIIAYFVIFIRPNDKEEEEDLSFLKQYFIKLEDHYFNEKYSSLNSLVPEIRKKLNSNFKIGDTAPKNGIVYKYICYGDTNKDGKNKIDRHFYLNLHNKNIDAILYKVSN